MPINTFVQLWSRLIEKCGLYRALTRFKTEIFHNSRANSFRVTGRISLPIELIRDLVPINTVCNFGPDCWRNVVSIVLTSLKTAIFNLSGAITLE